MSILTIQKPQTSLGRREKGNGEKANAKRYAFKENTVECFLVCEIQYPITSKKQIGFTVKKL